MKMDGHGIPNDFGYYHVTVTPSLAVLAVSVLFPSVSEIRALAVCCD